jgi:sortase A
VLLARILGGIGRTLIWVGAIILLFVAYQLWGTNLAEARAQDDLASAFEAQLADTTATTPDDRGDEGSDDEGDDDPEPGPTTTATTDPPPPPDDGEAVARLVIPRIGVDKIVVEGVDRRDLQKGPGHYPDTPLPGQPGNASIAGHRTTYGAPFHRVDELVAGDEILVTTLQGSFRYEVVEQQIVSPSDVHVVEDQGDDRLTLTSCHPKYSARQRIVVTAALVDDPAPAPPARTPREEQATGEQAAAEEPALEVLDGDDRASAGPAIAWGAVVLAVWVAFYVLSRRWRRIPAYVLGAPVFGVALFVFFEAVAETLPANF